MIEEKEGADTGNSCKSGVFSLIDGVNVEQLRKKIFIKKKRKRVHSWKVDQLKWLFSGRSRP